MKQNETMTFGVKIFMHYTDRPIVISF